MLTIRPARADDLGFVLSATRSLGQMAMNRSDPPMHPGSGPTYLEMLTDTDRHHMVIAQGADGRSLGMAMLALCKSIHFGGWTADLQDLFIADNARGKGVGRALMKYIDNFARERKLTCVTLMVLPPGSVMDEERNLFYKRNGYQLNAFCRYKTFADSNA
jgi:GNAT superfamily N-acetyltransferase